MSIDWTTETKGTGAYTQVNGINLYYETHGAGSMLFAAVILDFLDRQPTQG